MSGKLCGLWLVILVYPVWLFALACLSEFLGIQINPVQISLQKKKNKK